MLEDSTIDPAVAVDTNVKNIITASREPPRNRQQDVSQLIASVAEYAYDRGLPSSLIEQLLNTLTTKTTLDQSSTTTLVQYLYPADRVSSRCVLKLVSSLGVGKRKPSLTTQALLLRWLCNIYSILEDPAIVARLYSVLWSLLDIMSFQPALCQILALITRRRHVKPFRVQQLYAMNDVAGHIPEFRALCQVYKTYYPDILIGSMPHARITAAGKSDAAWRARLADIQTMQSNINPFNIVQTMINGSTSSKHHRIVPRIQTHLKSKSSLAIEDIRDVSTLVENLERIETPSQIAATMESSMLQRYLEIRPSKSANDRLQFWLAQCLDELLITEELGQSAALASEMLSLVLFYVKSLRDMPPIVEAFTYKYARIWNGTSDVMIMLELLTYLPGASFLDLHRDCLSFIEASLGRNNSNALELLSRFYSDLLQRRVLTLSVAAQSGDASFIRDLQAHVSILHLSALIQLSEGNATVSSIVRFYEALAQLSQTAATIPVGSAAVLLPSPYIVNLLVFAFQSDTLSRLCTILTAYKASFEIGIKSSVRWPADFTNRFNGFLMDVCNLLWRSRALTTADTNSLGCLCPEPTATALRSYLTLVDREYALSSLFGFSHNMLLCGFSLSALQELESEQGVNAGAISVGHVGPASQRTLAALEKEGGARVSWKEYRVACLQWLHDRGVSGVRDLMLVTMKDLMKT